MQKCPFHEGSTSTTQTGELREITCPVCGEYRISSVALQQISSRTTPPSGWSRVLAKGRLISTRDTRALLASAG